MESAPFRMVSTPHPMSKKGFPLDRLSIDLRTGKYYYDLNEQEAALDQLAVEDGFLQFFERAMEEYHKMERYELRTIRQDEMEQALPLSWRAFRRMRRAPKRACASGCSTRRSCFWRQ